MALFMAKSAPTKWTVLRAQYFILVLFLNKLIELSINLLVNYYNSLKWFSLKHF